MPPRSNDHAAFGRAVRELRHERLGISQEEFAERCGLDRTYVGGIERGERNVALANIIRVSAALDIAPSALFERFESLRGSP
jgi:transcriptional regulator with XRE-family HTH domain